jgi:hypothetical protein
MLVVSLTNVSIDCSNDHLLLELQSIENLQLEKCDKASRRKGSLWAAVAENEQLGVLRGTLKMEGS